MKLRNRHRRLYYEVLETSLHIYIWKGVRDCHLGKQNLSPTCSCECGGYHVQCTHECSRVDGPVLSDFVNARQSTGLKLRTWSIFLYENMSTIVFNMYIERVGMWMSKLGGRKLLPVFVCFVYILLKKIKAQCMIFSFSFLEAAACLH